MKKKLIIVGNGETAELAYLYFTNDSEYEVAAFAVEKDYITESRLRRLVQPNLIHFVRDCITK